MRKVIKIIMLAGADILVAAAIIIGSYWYTYVKPYKLKSLAVTVTSSAADETTKVSQDWKTKFAEYFTADIISKKMSYSSPNIAVDIQKKEMGTGHNKVTYYVADIHIASINCLQTKFAWDTYGVGYYQSLKKMSGEVSAVMAINGDSYSNDRHSDSGTIIRNGVVYRMEDTIYDVCVLYSDGTMRTFAPNEFDANQAIKEGAYQTWIFGPALLDDNGKAKTSFNTWDYIRRSHPRSAIGYYEPGHYCMIVVDSVN